MESTAMPINTERWYFSKEEMGTFPSIRCGLKRDKELTNRQQAAMLIQDMGTQLRVDQLTMNTAIVYMHRFYAFHSFTKFQRYFFVPATLFLAIKVHEQRGDMRDVIQVFYGLVGRGHYKSKTLTEKIYEELREVILLNENILLQTLGFDIFLQHPHEHIEKFFAVVQNVKELSAASYLLATNSLHMTTMCLQYTPSVVACVCIYIACKWSNNEIQRLNEGDAFYSVIDPTVTEEMLQTLTAEFLDVMEKFPNRLKRGMDRLNSIEKLKQIPTESQSEAQQEPGLSVDPVSSSRESFPSSKECNGSTNAIKVASSGNDVTKIPITSMSASEETSLTMQDTRGQSNLANNEKENWKKLTKDQNSFKIREDTHRSDKKKNMQPNEDKCHKLEKEKIKKKDLGKQITKSNVSPLEALVKDESSKTSRKRERAEDKIGKARFKKPLSVSNWSAPRIGLNPLSPRHSKVQKSYGDQRRECRKNLSKWGHLQSNQVPQSTQVHPFNQSNVLESRSIYPYNQSFNTKFGIQDTVRMEINPLPPNSTGTSSVPQIGMHQDPIYQPIYPIYAVPYPNSVFPPHLGYQVPNFSAPIPGFLPQPAQYPPLPTDPPPYIPLPYPL